MTLTSDTQQTIERFLRGDEGAYTTIHQWVATVVKAGKLGQILQPYRDDIVQEVMLEVFRNLQAGKFGGRATLKVYIQRITQNICINWWHRHGRRLDTPVPLSGLSREPVYIGKNPYQIVESSDREKRWGAAIRQLPKDCQRLLQMVWGERRRYREIATVLNTTETVIKQRVHRCGQKLAEAVKEGGTQNPESRIQNPESRSRNPEAGVQDGNTGRPTRRPDTES